MSEYREINVRIDFLDFLLGVEIGFIIASAILIALKDKKDPAKIIPVRRGHRAEKEEVSNEGLS